MKYTIEVTQEDIVNGCRRNPTACPIAKAACKVLPKTKGSIIVSKTELLQGNMAYRSSLASLPKAACEFVRNFDLGLEVKPFSFEIEL